MKHNYLEITKKAELRIGNYVFATCPGNQPCNNLKQIKNGTDIDNADWFFGIAISEEILYKFGFVKEGKRWLRTSEYYSFILNCCSDRIDFKSLLSVEFQDKWYETTEIKDIKSVHDLQNMFFSLTDEELKFNE